MCIFGGAIVSASGADIVYVDSGVTSYCRSPQARDAVAELYVRSTTPDARLHYYLWPAQWLYTNKPPSIVRFPLAWTIIGKTCRIVLPNVIDDAMNRTMLEVLKVDDMTLPEKNPSLAAKDVGHCGDARRYGLLSCRLNGCMSGAFTVDLLEDARCEIVWHGFSGSSFIARLPLSKELAGTPGDIWKPCANPAVFRWMEFHYTGWESGENDLKPLASQDVPPDGFSPVACVRIAGKRVISDAPGARFPSGADWLIWEKYGDTGRLCQMRGGRWSVYQEATRTDAPQTIVINNDTDTVFLLYSLSVAPADVESSIDKIAVSEP